MSYQRTPYSKWFLGHKLRAKTLKEWDPGGWVSLIRKKLKKEQFVFSQGNRALL